MRFRIRHMFFASIGIAAVVLMWFATRPAPLPPEVAINQLIDDGVGALGRSDSSAALDLVSEDFRGSVLGSGEVDRDELSRQLGLYLMRGGIDVTVVTRDVTLDGPTQATANLRVVGVQGGLAGALGGEVDGRLVVLGLALEGTDWRVVSFHSP